MPKARIIEVLESIWTVAGRVPLRAKIIGIVLAATCLTGSGVLLWAESRLSRAVAEFGGQSQPFELNELLVIMLIAMTVGLIVAWLLTNVLTQQITHLTRIARQVQRGDLSPRAPVWADDEIGQLATTLNAMIHSLSQSQVTLEIANERLGQRNEQLSALYELAALAAQSMDSDRILADGLAKALDITAAEAGAVLLLDANGTRAIHAERGLPPCLRADPQLFTRIDPFLTEAIETGRQVRAAFCCPDCCDETPPPNGGCGYVALCAAPIQARRSVNGVLVLMWREGRPVVSADMTDSPVQAICSQLGIAVENAELWAELKRRDAARARLLANAVTAQEQERERISRELHDETGQALTALLVQLKVLERLRDPQAILAHAETLRQLVLDTLEEVRRLARDLRPGMLDELGLVPTLEWHIRGFAHNAGLPVDFEARVSEDFRLPVHTELALYRVVQEALTNIVRHADATSADVRLDENGGLLRLTVTDDGRGFDVAAAMNAEERGVGLLGIQERVELIGGVLALDSSPGQGARLSVEVPLPERVGVL